MSWGLNICTDCSYVFGEPKKYTENHGEETAKIIKVNNRGR